MGRLAGPLLLALAYGLVVAVALRGDLPLTFDEAFNYAELAAHGPAWVATHYPFANNHVLFTLLQSVAVQPAWMRHNPQLLRVPNLLVGAALLFELRAGLGRTRRVVDAWALTLAIAFASPVFATYLFVARGYLLATALLIAAVRCRANGRSRLAALLHGLATYTVPTCAFALPASLVWSAFEHSTLRDATRPRVLLAGVVWPAIVFAVVVGIGYAPIAAEVMAAGHHFHPYASAGVFLQATLTSWSAFGELGLGAWPGVVAVAAAIGWLLHAWRGRGHLDRLERMTALACLTATTTLAGALTLPLVGIGNLPFVRSLSFVAPLLAFGLAGAGVWCDTNERRAWVGIGLRVPIVASAAVTILLLARAVVSGPPMTFPRFAELTPSPLDRALRDKVRLRGMVLVGTWQEAPLLGLFADALHYTPRTAPTAPDTTTCWRGHIAPEPMQRILVERDGRPLGLLCY